MVIGDNNNIEKIQTYLPTKPDTFWVQEETNLEAIPHSPTQNFYPSSVEPNNPIEYVQGIAITEGDPLPDGGGENIFKKKTTEEQTMIKKAT